MKKFGGAGRLKKACKQRICTSNEPTRSPCPTNASPPNISETISKLKSLADKYSKYMYLSV